MSEIGPHERVDSWRLRYEVERLTKENDKLKAALARAQRILDKTITIEIKKERDELARALSVRTKERDAAVSSAKRLQAIVTSEALERYPPR